MDTQPVAVDRSAGLRAFSWARFAVMMALIGTPSVACAWLLIRQPAPDRTQAVPAAAQTDSRPLVIVIPSPSPVAQHNEAQSASPAPQSSHATTSLSPDAQKPVVQGSTQSTAA